MKNKLQFIILIILSFAVIVIGVALGSVRIPVNDVIQIIFNRITGNAIPQNISDSNIAIVLKLRLPRTLLAFIVGSGLSVSGAVMQSVLRNPLASAYTLGVSSGASLGACIVILYGLTIPFMPSFTLPLVGFVFGFITIVAAVFISVKIDGQMQNNTVILIGMVFSLFINAVTTLLSSISREQIQRLIYWQMGSFAMKEWSAVYVLAPITIIGIVLICMHNNELDIMTFGENQAQIMGINIKKVKWTLLILSALLTGSAISFAGVIGFVDLASPHIIRRIFGSSHKYVIPMSALFGGVFMVICDLISRTVISPSELPVGTVTAIIGAPFFAYIYFSKKDKK